MRTRIVIAATIAMILMLVAPAASAGKPSLAQEIYFADITFVSESGIATSCVDDELDPVVLELVGTDERKGITHFESHVGAPLAITGNLEWEGNPVEGCHGNLLYPEYFRITLGDDGTIAMLWIFDVEETEQIITLKNGRTRAETVRTGIRMGGPYNGDVFAATDISEANGELTFTASGTFSFVHYSSDGEPMMVNLVNSPQYSELVVTLTLK